MPVIFPDTKETTGTARETSAATAPPRGYPGKFRNWRVPTPPQATSLPHNPWDLRSGGLSGLLAVFRPALLLRRRDPLTRGRAQFALTAGGLRLGSRRRGNRLAFQLGLNLTNLLFDPLFLDFKADQRHLQSAKILRSISSCHVSLPETIL